MEKLTELAYLDLSGNELSSLPRMLSKLTHLSHIRIDHRDVARFSSSNDAILSEPTKNAADGPHPSQGSDVSRSDERDVFISHNSSDSILAILIAKELEHRGYPVWYFERDKVSIISYLEATNLALKASKTMLLLITEHSVTAHEVLTEVQNAHKERIPIIPVRYKIEHDDYRKRSLDMDQAIGCGGEIKIEVENIDRAIDEIIAGLRHLHILPKSN